MNIGIFGGSFNPPHKMHENIAEYLIKKHILDKVIFVPTGSKYEYKKMEASPIDRYNMLKLIADKYEYFSVSDFELKDKPVYTYETLDHFKDKYPNSTIYFICGLDNLSYIDEWKNAEYILKNFKILAFRRDNLNPQDIISRLTEYKDNIIIVDLEEKDISSTAIRETINTHNVSSNLDCDVLKYIKDNNLYNEVKK